MTYTLFYTAEDSDAALCSWTVRAEDYPQMDSTGPIEGTDRLVASGFATEQDADDRASHLQVRSYAVPNKRGNDNA